MIVYPCLLKGSLDIDGIIKGDSAMFMHIIRTSNLF